MTRRAHYFVENSRQRKVNSQNTKQPSLADLLLFIAIVNPEKFKNKGDKLFFFVI